MVEPGVDERPSAAVWPPVTVEHQYAVSEALPLHRLGLVPPPPEIGPHLLTASPIEAALAAAEATAELQAIPAPQPEPEPEPEADAASHPALEACETAVVAVESGTGASAASGWPEATHLSDPDTGISMTSDDPLSIMPPDVPVTALASAEAADGETHTSAPDAGTGQAPGSLSWSLNAAADGDEPLALVDGVVKTATSADGTPSGPAHAKLMRLDLSRRGDAPPAKEMPLPLLPDAPLPAVRPSVPSPAQAPAAARPRMSQYEPPSGNWPGFLTGIVMAVAIGVGLTSRWWAAEAESAGKGMRRSGRRVAIVGGSHAGLLTALVLERIGCEVTVYERSRRKLEARGAGLRIQPAMAEMLGRIGIDLTPASTFTHWDRHIGPGNRVIHDAPEAGHFVSWGSLYRFLLGRFGTERYRFGEACAGVEQVAGGVHLRFESGTEVEADLAVFADGIASTGRRLLLPGVAPVYAGYVAWRGLVHEAEISPETRAVLDDACTFTVAGLSHMPIYPVPGEDGEAGRLLNFIWYRNVAEGADLDALMTGRDGVHRPLFLPDGLVEQRAIDTLKREAVEQLPPAAAEVIVKSPSVFIQPICDLLAEPMALGRCVFIGDAAAVTRPHVGAGTTKAMLAAVDLAQALELVDGGADLDAELAGWSAKQVALARDLLERGAMMGRRAQVEGTWRPGLPELSRITMGGTP